MMTSKPSHANTPTQSRIQQPLGLTDRLLSIVLDLPANPTIAYAVFTPTANTPLPHESLETARGKILDANRGKPILDSIFYSVRVEQTAPALYVYKIISSERAKAAFDSIKNLQFDALTMTSVGTFEPQAIHSHLESNANGPYSPKRTRFTTSEVSETVYTNLIDAIKDSILSSLCDVSSESCPRPVKRLKDGFVIGTRSDLSEWTNGWNIQASSRPLLHCLLHIYFSQKHIVVHPVPHYIPLTFFTPSSNIPAGTPLCLMPHGIPAYYLTMYDGPTMALTTQFSDSLRGLGAGSWSFPMPRSSSSKHSLVPSASYIVVWVRVQNKNGEDKGMLVIWPSSLALSYTSSSLSLPPLACIPELPAQLQHSPRAVPTDDQTSGDVISMSSRFSVTLAPGFFSASSSPTKAALRAFRLTGLSHPSGILNAALQVGSYVDTVVKERDKERERLRREREAPKPVLPTPPTASPAVPEIHTTTHESVSATPQQPVHADTQDFYPSPQMATPSDIAFDDQETPEINIPPSAPDPPFDSFGSGWDQSAPTYNYDIGSAAMDLSFDTTFNADVDITDDDFSFFDRPTAPGASGHGNDGFLNPTQDMSILPSSFLPLFGHDVDLSGPGPPDTLHSIPGWMPSEQVSPAPELLAPFQEITPSSQGALPTPESNVPIPLAAPINIHPSKQGKGTFGPVVFAPNYRLVDDKYASGKFALSNPASVPEVSAPKELSAADALKTWKDRYDAATDPRLSIVRMLKRKSLVQGKRNDPKLSPSWMREMDDWISSSPLPPEDEEEKSDDDSEEGDNAFPDSPLLPRPSTPLPSYLPLGPTLLHFQFQHAHLLPLSWPLKPPGSIASSGIITGPAAFVPTPVSPETMLGALEERSQALESTARILASEIVFNPVWSVAWLSNKSNLQLLESDRSIWQTDVEYIAKLFGTDPGLGKALTMGTLFKSQGTFHPMEQPMLCVGKSSAVIDVLPSALRFWEKLGLEPRGGSKDLSLFMLFRPADEDRECTAEGWMSQISSRWMAQNLGKLSLGEAIICSKPGLIPVRLDAFRKTFKFLLSTILSRRNGSIIFLVLPDETLSLASQPFRQIVAEIVRTRAKHGTSNLIFHLLPESVIFGTKETVSTESLDLDSVCRLLYERALRPVSRATTRETAGEGLGNESYLPSFAFTLAQSTLPTAKFVHQNPVRSLDVFNRRMLLHVGYCLTPDNKWLLAACIDQRGEMSEVNVWLTQDDGSDAFVTRSIWRYTVQMAARANIEWRIAIVKLGLMAFSEISAWEHYLWTNLGDKLIYDSVSVFSADPTNPWRLLGNRLPSQNASKAETPRKEVMRPLYIEDDAADNYALYPSIELPLPIRQVPQMPTPSLPFIPDAEDSPKTEERSVIPISSATLAKISRAEGAPSTSMLHVHLMHNTRRPETSSPDADREILHDVIHNYYELAVLTRARYRLHARPILPFHLAALEVIGHAFDLTDPHVTE